MTGQRRAPCRDFARPVAEPARPRSADRIGAAGRPGGSRTV